MSKKAISFIKKNILQNKKIITTSTLIIVLSGLISSGKNFEVRAFDEEITTERTVENVFTERLGQKNKFKWKGVSLEENAENLRQKQLENDIKRVVIKHPLEEMAPFIAKYDRQIAALIVGIAKKESNWGKRSPAKNGKTCYNYWGYKGAGKAGKALGHGCFATAEEAVNVIGKRIKDLGKQGLNTPAKMIIWKCGRSCAGHSEKSVKKWISDVDLYYNKIAMK